MRRAAIVYCLVAGFASGRHRVLAEDVQLEPLLATIRTVGPHGQNHRAASQAWQQIARADGDQLPAILAGLDSANPLAANWIHAAVDAVAQRQLRRGEKLPVAQLEKYLSDTRHNPKGRRLAYEWIARVDASAPDRLIPRMLNDPSVELRRDAVARLLDEADRKSAAQKPEIRTIYELALTAARDGDQVRRASDALKKLGVAVNLPRHFGFITQWKLIGPFDNTGKNGFGISYPPEQKFEPGQSYQGKAGDVGWIDHATAEEYGRVDLNKALGKDMCAIAYAAAEFISPGRQPVELRMGSTNANKIWLNGQLLHQAEVYHANVQMDQYTTHGTMEPGRNLILVKICQNEQTDNWAQDWKFHLRVCDATGTAILSQPADANTAQRAARTTTKEVDR